MYKQIILSKEMIIYYYMIINVNDILCKVSILQIYFIHTRIYRVPGWGGGGVLGKFLDPRMFSFVTQLLNIVRLFMLQIVC